MAIKILDPGRIRMYTGYLGLWLTANTLVGTLSRNLTPAGHYRFCKAFGRSSAASSTTKVLAVVYFDPKIAQGSDQQIVDASQIEALNMVHDFPISSVYIPT